MHPIILKELAEELAIIYKCIDKGTLPSKWKEVIVTLIFKKRMQVVPQQLQTSVTYFSSPGKNNNRKHIGTFKEQLQISVHSNMGSQQDDPLPHLLDAVKIWSEALSYNVPVEVIFLDYAKAFDTVPYIRRGKLRHMVLVEICWHELKHF